ncbi:hypothetical protein L1887_19530 [Cichorium endivia]|nr:hypothetical protein L1887_19530 [Cichorium endivia]
MRRNEGHRRSGLLSDWREEYIRDDRREEYVVEAWLLCQTVNRKRGGRREGEERLCVRRFFYRVTRSFSTQLHRSASQLFFLSSGKSTSFICIDDRQNTQPRS